MDETTKETLLGQFRAYLDGFDEGREEGPEKAGEEADLFSVFVELAGLRNEVRTESRLVKDALEQFRGVFDTLQASHAAMEADLSRARADTREHGRAVLRPLLLDILDLRDRLAAGLRSGGAAVHQPRWFESFRLKAKAEAEPWREGLIMTLRRLDRLLADRRIVAIDTVGRPFDPRLARAIATIQDPVAEECIVVEELRPGFMWEDELLRAAEVTVVKGGRHNPYGFLRRRFPGQFRFRQRRAWLSQHVVHANAHDLSGADGGPQYLAADSRRDARP